MSIDIFYDISLHWPINVFEHIDEAKVAVQLSTEQCAVILYKDEVEEIIRKSSGND